MAHYGDRTDRRPRHVRLLGAQCQRRPGYRDIEQRTDWNYEDNVELAQTEENSGAEYQHESTSFSLGTADTVTEFRRDHGSLEVTPLEQVMRFNEARLKRRGSLNHLIHCAVGIHCEVGF